MWVAGSVSGVNVTLFPHPTIPDGLTDVFANRVAAVAGYIRRERHPDPHVTPDADSDVLGFWAALEDARSIQRALGLTAPATLHGTVAELVWTLDRARVEGLA